LNETFSSHLPALLSLQLEDSSPAEIGSALFLPGALLLIGAAFGGLRALMASPLRANLMKDLPEGTQKNIEKIALIKGVTSAAGLGRLFSITIAVALLITATAPVQDATKAPLWIGIAIVAGLLLEGVPALVERGRGIRTLVLFIPLLKAVAFVLRPFTLILGNIVESISTDT